MQHQTMTRHKRLKMAHHNLFYVKMYSWGGCFLPVFIFVSWVFHCGLFVLSD